MQKAGTDGVSPACCRYSYFSAECLSVFVLVLLLFPADRLSAQEQGDWNLNLFFENDLFTDTDLNYTNGIRLTAVSPDLTTFRDPEGESYPVFEHLNDFLLGLEFPLHPSRFRGDNPQLNVSASIGQLMFTPSDRYRTDIDPNDRPYAGWLYLGVGLQSRTDDVLYSMELDIGMVGPAALGEEAQNLIHDLRSIDRFEGWDNQLRNEPGFMLSTERKDRLFDTVLINGTRWETDFIRHVGVRLGNVITNINAGAEWRIGYNLPDDFGTSTLRPGGDSSTPGMPQQRGRTWRLQAFVATNARLVLRNIFLDGNTFRNSHSVDKEYLVAEAAIGMALAYKRWRLSYASVYRTREFRQQDGAHEFGSISLSYSTGLSF